MNPIVRNFVSVFRRFRLAMTLNILGLAAAFAAFVVIMMQIGYERGFEDCHPNADRIYRVEFGTEQWESFILARPFVYSFVHSSPQIEAGTILCPYMDKSYITVERNGAKVGFNETITTCYPEITRMFHFQMLGGSADCLQEGDKVLVPESTARKLFGEGPAVGKQINLETGTLRTKGDYKFLVVGGVYRDFPGNTQINNFIYTGMGDDFTKDDWRSQNYFCYVMLRPGADPQSVADNFSRTFDFNLLQRGDEGEYHISLTPIKDIYYLNESQDGHVLKSGDPDMARLLICIAFLVILIACINYTNIYTALAPIRIRSINTQKVLGSTDGALRRMLVGEAMLVSFFSYLLGLVIVFYLREFGLLDFVKADIDFGSNLGLLALAAGFSLVIGAVAGLYPSYYVTSFPPALVLKGSFGLSPTGRRLRTVLVGFQFVVSLLLIICASFVYIQTHYMRKINLGFDKDQVAIVELSPDLIEKSKDAYINKLKSNPGIEDVAFSAQKLGASDGYMTWSLQYKNILFGAYVFPVSWNFFETMGIQVIDGRKPTESDERGNKLVFYGYKTMRDQLQAVPGDRLAVTWMNDSIQMNFAGFTDDIQFSSARQKLGFGVFVLNNHNNLQPVSYIRIKAGADIDQIISHIRATVRELDASYPIDIEFYDTIFNQLYQREENLKQMITLFSSLAILISLAGVFSLVMFEAIYRRKEVAIRRVMGSTVGEILRMFGKGYVYTVGICFVVAAPVAYWAVSTWLEHFAYKTPLHLWVFALALVIVLFVTLATVVYQSWQAATTNPVNSLRNE